MVKKNIWNQGLPREVSVLRSNAVFQTRTSPKSGTLFPSFVPQNGSIQQRERKLRAAEMQVLEKTEGAQAFSSSCLFFKWTHVQNNNVRKDEDEIILKKNKKIRKRHYRKKNQKETLQIIKPGISLSGNVPPLCNTEHIRRQHWTKIIAFLIKIKTRMEIEIKIQINISKKQTSK